MSGIGERLQPVSPPPLWLLLVNPGVAVSTPAVFKARDGVFSTVAEPRRPPPDLRAFVHWLQARGNDLEAPACRLRSEEHTSELQSLMRISYAVFCLKKTKHIQYTSS